MRHGGGMAADSRETLLAIWFCGSMVWRHLRSGSAEDGVCPMRSHSSWTIVIHLSFDISSSLCGQCPRLTGEPKMRFCCLSQYGFKGGKNACSLIAVPTPRLAVLF